MRKASYLNYYTFLEINCLLRGATQTSTSLGELRSEVKQRASSSDPLKSRSSAPTWRHDFLTFYQTWALPLFWELWGTSIIILSGNKSTDSVKGHPAYARQHPHTSCLPSIIISFTRSLNHKQVLYFVILLMHLFFLFFIIILRPQFMQMVLYPTCSG